MNFVVTFFVLVISQFKKLNKIRTDKINCKISESSKFTHVLKCYFSSFNLDVGQKIT